MHRSHRKISRPRQILPPRSRRGAVIPLFAFLLIILIAAASFTIDVAYMHSVRSELQHSVDAAARAASNSLGSTQDLSIARQAAKDIAAINSVAGSSLVLTDDDIIFGQSQKLQSGRYQFTEGVSPTNAVRVRGARTDSSASGPVRLFMGSLMGREFFAPQLFASAARVDRDIMMVVDRSGSMGFDETGTDYSYTNKNKHQNYNYSSPPHVTGSRWAGLLEAAKVFREAIDDTREEERIGLVSYAHAYTIPTNLSQVNPAYKGFTVTTVDTDATLTANSSIIEAKLAQIGQKPVVGGTNISSGLDRAIQVIQGQGSRQYAFKMILLMTDGVWNEGRDPILSAQDAAELGIIVHAVTFSAGANQADMQEVAQITGGKFYHAPTRAELKAAFREIAYSIPVILVE